jgi:hypothetical protein
MEETRRGACGGGGVCVKTFSQLYIFWVVLLFINFADNGDLGSSLLFHFLSKLSNKIKCLSQKRKKRSHELNVLLFRSRAVEKMGVIAISGC